MRTAEVERKTKETEIKIKLNIDGAGTAEVRSEIGFLNHMLESFAKHGLFDLDMNIKGDLEVDQHHTVEDSGIVLGQAFARALGLKEGIKRSGHFSYPMDEALASAALDVSGRPFLVIEAEFKDKKAGDLETALVHDFFQGFVAASDTTLHLKVEYGRSDHHKIEALFKAFGKALKQACEKEPRIEGKIPSTKGKL